MALVFREHYAYLKFSFKVAVILCMQVTHSNQHNVGPQRYCEGGKVIYYDSVDTVARNLCPLIM